MAITRKAIIIGNTTGYNAPTFLGGVDKDVVNYKNYLKSDIGGEWNDSEITVLYNRNKREIIKAIADCYGDYSFVVFSGHGFFYTPNEQTYICVKDNYISEIELNTYLNKQSLILDCCREKTVIMENLSGLIGDTFSKGGTVRPPRRRVINARRKFDDALTISTPGSFVGYSCLVDETSGDNPTAGGVFSSALIREGRRFGSVNNTNTSWCAIRKAVINAAASLRRNPFSNQMPTYITTPSEMELTHPFAITNRL